MKATLCFVVVALLCAGAFAGDDPQQDYRVLIPGTFHGSDIDSVDGEDWYGLFQIGTVFVLESVAVQAKQCHDPIVDQPGDSTGISVSVDHSEKPLVLVQCRGKLKPGVVPTTSSDYTPIKPGMPVHLKGYSLAALGEVTDEGFRHPGDLLILNYTLMLYRMPGGSRGQQETKRQVLVQFERTAYDGLPTLLWAGDLDRDGQLDLLMDIRNHYAGRHYALFLSSEADNNDLVKLVADLRLSGC